MSIIITNLINDIIDYQTIIEKYTQMIINHEKAITSINDWKIKNGDVSFFDVLPIEIIKIIIDYLNINDICTFRKSCKRNNKLIISQYNQKIENKNEGVILKFLDTITYNLFTLREYLGCSDFAYGIVAHRSKYVLFDFGKLLGIRIFGEIIIFETFKKSFVCVSLNPKVEYFLMPSDINNHTICVPVTDIKLAILFQNILVTNNWIQHPLVPVNKKDMCSQAKEILNGKTPYLCPSTATYAALRNMFGKASVDTYVSTYESMTK